MIPSLAVFNQYLYGKKESLACSITIKRFVYRFGRPHFFTFVSGVLAGGTVRLIELPHWYFGTNREIMKLERLLNQDLQKFKLSQLLYF